MADRQTDTEPPSTMVEAPATAPKRAPAKPRRRMVQAGSHSLPADQVEGFDYGCIHVRLRDGGSRMLQGGSDDIRRMTKAVARGDVLDLTEIG